MKTCEKTDFPQIPKLPQTSDMEVVLVGMEFEAGTKGSIEITEALGAIPVLVGDTPHMIQEQALMEPMPDYCADEELVTALLEAHDIDATVFPLKDTGCGSFEPGYVAVFKRDGVFHMTTPQNEVSEALACVLWFYLTISQ